MTNRELPYDHTLTPESAKGRGYEFETHIPQDDMPDEFFDEYMHLVENEGYAVGQPASSMGADVWFGLYAPIKKK